MKITSPRPPRTSRLWRILLFAFTLAFDVVAAVWVWSIFSLGLWLVGVLVVVVVAGINLAVLRVRATALRWMLPTLAFMLVFTLAPIVYTAYISLTNFNDTHLLTQQQATAALARQTFVPEGETTFAWAAYRANDGALAVYLVPQGDDEASSGQGDSSTKTPDPSATPDATADTPADVFATTTGTSVPGTPGEGIFGAADDAGFPRTIDGYTRLTVVEAVTQIGEITDATFGVPPTTYRVVSSSSAAPIESTYEIDPGSGAVTDRRDGTVYHLDASGFFIAEDGSRLSPAFQTVVGLQNFVELFGNERLRGPFLQILVWTIIFAVVVVALQFALGLLYAVTINSRYVRPVMARVLRAVLLLPYVIPAYLTILVWSALFNQRTGLIPSTLLTVFGLDPAWVNDPNGARLAMLVVGVWLGFPYFLLICTGALQSIPADLIEAAQVDGAGPWTRFRRVVFPLLMRSIAPLVVLAAAFNFNNFLLAFLLFGGGPPKTDTRVPAGETDLLISFTYKLSFDYGGAEYALAAAVTVLIFLALTPIVLSQLRYYNSWRRED